MSEQRKSFTSHVILSLGLVVFLLVAAGCQNAGNEKLPDGAKRHLDELIGTGRYRIVSEEKGSNPKGLNSRSGIDEAWCIVLNGPHELRDFGHPTLEFGDTVDGDYSIIVYRIGNLWKDTDLYAYRNHWLIAGCGENTYTDPY